MQDEQLVNIIVKLSGLSAIEMNASLAEIGFQDSISIWKLHAALERVVKCKVKPISKKMSVSEVLQHFNITAASGIEQVEPENLIRIPKQKAKQIARQINYSDEDAASMRTDQMVILGIGTDIEEIKHIPEPNDYREHEFYHATFSEREIAQAVLHDNPRQHFCGLFCAKEALKKCAQVFLALRMDEIEIFNKQGVPNIYLHQEELMNVYKFMCSISHTPQYANAIVLVQRYF